MGEHAPPSHATVKRLTRDVCALLQDAEPQQPLRWSHVPITFSADDHPTRQLGFGVIPFVVSPIISNMTVTKVLVDNGAGLNLLSARLVEKLQLPVEQLNPTDPFRGANPGIVRPLGRITLPVTFGSREAFRIEHIVFDMEHPPLLYNGILGRPALIKFMAATHCAYDVMKMPSVYGVLSIRMMAQSHGACNSNKSTCASYT